MSLLFVAIVVIVTALASTAFVVIVNYQFIKSGINNLDFKNVVTQLIALTAWLTILSKALLPIDPAKTTESLILFATSVIMGAVLIRNLSKELQMRTKVNALIHRLQTNNEQLRELDKQKSEFVSLASHQLRGPLSVIQGYLSMVLEGDYGAVPNDIKKTLEKIQESTEGLGYLINDYLNVSRLDKGEMEYLIDDIQLIPLLDEIIRGFSVVAKRAHIELKKKYDPAPHRIRGDFGKTKQIISNIIDNSIKYTPHGSVEVAVTFTQTMARIVVSDTGIGIPENQLEAIFTKFNRTADAINVNVVGTGLGLYVAKVMTEAQQGKIWAESEGPGKGSRFIIELPLSRG